MWRSIHKAFLFVFPLLSVAQPCLHRLGNQVIVTKVSRCFEVMAIWIGFHFRSKFKHNCLIIIWVLFLEPIHRFLVSIPVSRQVFYHVARSRIQWGLVVCFQSKRSQSTRPSSCRGGGCSKLPLASASSSWNETHVVLDVLCCLVVVIIIILLSLLND